MVLKKGRVQWLTVLSIFAALKPYFVGLHFHGRSRDEDKDPDGFETWLLSDEQVTECLDFVEVMCLSKETPRKKSRKRKSSASEKSSPVETIYIPQQSEPDARLEGTSPLPARRMTVPAGGTIVPDPHPYQAPKYKGTTSALIDMARLRGIDMPPTTPPEVVRAALENFDLAWNSTSDVDPSRTDYENLYIDELCKIMKERGFKGWTNPRRDILIQYLKHFDFARAQRVALAGSDTMQNRLQFLAEAPGDQQQSHSAQSEMSNDAPVTIKREDSPMPPPTIKREDSFMRTSAPTPAPPNYGFRSGYGSGYGVPRTFDHASSPLRPANPFTQDQMVGNVPIGNDYQSNAGWPQQNSNSQHGFVPRPSFTGGATHPGTSFMGGGIHAPNPGATPRRSTISTYVKAGKSTDTVQSPRPSLIPTYFKANNSINMGQPFEAVSSTVDDNNSTIIGQDSRIMDSTADDSKAGKGTASKPTPKTSSTPQASSTPEASPPPGATALTPVPKISTTQEATAATPESTTSTLNPEISTTPDFKAATPESSTTPKSSNKPSPSAPNVPPRNLLSPSMMEETEWKKKKNEIKAQTEARKRSASVGEGVVREDGRWEFPGTGVEGAEEM